MIAFDLFVPPLSTIRPVPVRRGRSTADWFSGATALLGSRGGSATSLVGTGAKGAPLNGATALRGRGGGSAAALVCGGFGADGDLVRGGIDDAATAPLGDRIGGGDSSILGRSRFGVGASSRPRVGSAAQLLSMAAAVDRRPFSSAVGSTTAKALQRPLSQANYWLTYHFRRCNFT